MPGYKDRNMHNLLYIFIDIKLWYASYNLAAVNTCYMCVEPKEKKGQGKFIRASDIRNV